MKRQKNKSLPHADVYARLAPSKIQGIGVIAIRDILKGTDIFNEKPGKNEPEYPWTEVPKSVVAAMPEGPIKKLYTDFAVLEGDTFYCCESFNEMTVSYYLNHSKTPNCEEREPGCYFVAARDIKAGEELTVDYGTYSQELDGEITDLK